MGYKTKHRKYAAKQEYLLSIGYKTIEALEIVDILYGIDQRAQYSRLSGTGFLTTQIEYNG